MYDAIVDSVYGNPELTKRTFANLVDGVRCSHSLDVFRRDLKLATVLVSHRRFWQSPGCRRRWTAAVRATSFRVRVVGILPRHSDTRALGIVLIKLVTTQNPCAAAEACNRRWNAFLVDPDSLR
ncbi:hypothetical protein DFH06DRAFT_1303993 [Mycena polygramma]|nr:hypothetical protein DFH06DRAFT_1303993 [Mycena polygramma]